MGLVQKANGEGADRGSLSLVIHGGEGSMRDDLVKVLAAMGLGFFVVPVALVVILGSGGPADITDADSLIGLGSLLAAAVVGVIGAWRSMPSLIWAAGLVFAVMWLIDGYLLWIVPALFFLSAGIVSLVRS